MGNRYSEYTVENFIYLIHKNGLKKESLITSIKNSIQNEEQISKILQKVDFAYNRIDEPLENDIKYLLLIFPYGLVNNFSKNTIFNLEENRRLGFSKKIEEFKKYSSIGIMIYLILIILATIFFWIN